MAIQNNDLYSRQYGLTQKGWNIYQVMMMVMKVAGSQPVLTTAFTRQDLINAGFRTESVEDIMIMLNNTGIIERQRRYEPKAQGKTSWGKHTKRALNTPFGENL